MRTVEAKVVCHNRGKWKSESAYISVSNFSINYMLVGTVYGMFSLVVISIFYVCYNILSFDISKRTVTESHAHGSLSDISLIVTM